MRLCVIGNPNSIHVQRWLRAFGARGLEVHLIGEKPLAGPLPADILFHDLTRQTNRRKVRYAVWAQAVRRLVQAIRPDVLHAHQVSSAGWLAAAAGFRPWLVTSWGSDLLLGAQRSAAQRLLARWVLRRADYVTAVSPVLADAARRLGAAADRLEVAPWGVDTAVFHPAAEATTAPWVLSLRALRPLYNPLVVAQAIPLVLGRVPEARFVVRTHSVDPELLAQFRRIVDVAGAGEAVQFVGDLSSDHAIAELYRHTAVAVSVPTSDGTPQSVLEAMACGAVPVLSDLPALRAWVQEGVHASFVPAGDAAALAEAVARLLADSDGRAAMRQAGLRLVRERADSRVCLQRYEQIYAQLAAGQRPQPQPWQPVEGS